MAIIPRSIGAAIAQANQLWPARSKASDGTVGDADHRNRRSDHNPDHRGVIHAFDLTHDPANGVDCGQLVARLVARRDPRVKYIIFRRTIWRSYQTSRRKPWEPESYTGANPHTAHMHTSILSTEAAESDTSPWWTAPTVTPAPAPTEEDDMPDHLAVNDPKVHGDDRGRDAHWRVFYGAGNIEAVNGARDPAAQLAQLGVHRTDITGGYYDETTDKLVLTAAELYQEPDGSWNSPTFALDLQPARI